MANLLQQLLGISDDEQSGNRVEKDYPTYTKDPSGLTGVARYIAISEGIDIEEKKPANVTSAARTGVAKYLARMEGVEIDEAVTLTGVEKYLAKIADEEDEFLEDVVADVPLTGVAKYLAEQQAAKKKKLADSDIETQPTEPANESQLLVEPVNEEKNAIKHGKESKKHKPKKNVVKLSGGATRCQASTSKGRQCKRTNHLNVIKRTIHKQKYQFKVCGQHNNDSFKPYSGVMEH